MNNTIVIHDGIEERLLMPVHFQMAGAFAKSLPVFGDTAGSPDLLTDAELKPVSLSAYCPPIKDQNGIGACNAFATVYTLEYASRLAGTAYPTLSPGDLYRRICGGSDNGSLLEDAIREAMKGIAPASVIPELEWRRDNAGADKLRPMFAVLEYWTLPTVRHLMSAISRGFACNIGVMWKDGDKIDGNGWLPVNPRGGAGGHAICRDSIEYLNGKWGFGGPNSWSPNWGANGRMVIPADRIAQDAGQFGWFATRSVLVYQDGTNKLPSLAA